MEEYKPFGVFWCMVEKKRKAVVNQGFHLLGDGEPLPERETETGNPRYKYVNVVLYEKV